MPDGSCNKAYVEQQSKRPRPPIRRHVYEMKSMNGNPKYVSSIINQKVLLLVIPTKAKAPIELNNISAISMYITERAAGLGMRTEFVSACGGCSRIGSG